MSVPHRQEYSGWRWLMLACVAVSHVWTMTWLSWALVPMQFQNPALRVRGLAEALTWGCAAALGVVLGGAALAMVPGRMRRHQGEGAAIGGGCVNELWFVLAGVAGLAGGTAAAAMLGAASALLAAAAGVGIVFYRLAGRYFPALAVVGAGLWHAVVMALPDPALSFAWPVMLTVTQVMALGAFARVYGFARPGLTSRDGWVVALGWAFLALLLAGGMTTREVALLPITATVDTGMGRWMWVMPAAALAAFLVVALNMIARSDRRLAAERVTALGTWWLLIYNAAWLSGAGLWGAAAAVSGLLVIMAGLGVWILATDRGRRTRPGYRLS